MDSYVLTSEPLYPPLINLQRGIPSVGYQLFVEDVLSQPRNVLSFAGLPDTRTSLWSQTFLSHSISSVFAPKQSAFKVY